MAAGCDCAVFDQMLTPAAPSLCGLCAAGVVVITCEQQPSVSESWNAIFQTFKEEPFGVYMARDTFWCVAQAWAGSLPRLNQTLCWTPQLCPEDH